MLAILNMLIDPYLYYTSRYGMLKIYPVGLYVSITETEFLDI